MTLTEKPASLSLSQNLNRFVINTVQPINFTLKKGENVLMSQRYVSSENGLIEIDVKDIIHASLRYQLRESGEVYEQTELAADFTAAIDDTEVHFRVVRGGVANLEDAATTFLKQNWLTWQPTLKNVTYYSIEFLSYYAITDCVVKLKAYFSVSDIKTITYASLTGGKVYTLPLQYAVVAGKLDNRLPGAYDVWVESTSGERLTYVQRYRAEAAKSLQEDWVLFENSLGGMDSFRAYGEKSLEAKHTHNVAELGEETEEYRVDTERVYTKNTGYLSKDETKWLLDFFPSTAKYIFDGNVIRKITVTESSAKMVNEFDPCGYSFSYKFSEAVPLLNLARAEKPLEVLNIEIPEVGNFTIPPRLAEVIRLPLSEGVLFPVQHPYSENWGTTTLGAMASVISQFLGEQAGTGGGVGHQHKNIDLLNLLGIIEQYLTIDGKKIHAGYADEAGSVKDADKKYVRKDIPETLILLLKLIGGAEIGEAIDSMLSGKGTILTADGRIQTDTLEVRQSMKVLELIINRLQGMENDIVFAPTRKILWVEVIDETTYKLFLDPKHDGDIIPFRDGNICYSIVNDILTGGSNYYTSYVRVLTTNQNDYSITASLYPDSEVPGGKNYIPTAGYNLSRRGHVNLTDHREDAQSWYLSSSEGRFLFLQNVVKPVLEDYNYALSVGKFPRVQAIQDIGLPEDAVGMMAETIVAQRIYQYDYNGDVVPNIVDRGPWNPETAQSEDKPYRNITVETQRPDGTKYTLLEQHAAWNYGCLWGCLVDKTTEEPRWNAQSWSLLQGDRSYSMKIISTEGEQFRRGQVDTNLVALVSHAFEDITATLQSLPGVEVEWLRDTGMAPLDNLWKPTYVEGNRLTIHISNADMTEHFPFQVRKVIFTCRVFNPAGELIAEQNFGFK